MMDPVKPRTPASLRVPTAALAAVILLSGCSDLTMDRAATIGDRTIGVDELQETTAQLNEISAQPAAPAAVLTELTRTPILDEAMSGSPLELTEQSVRELVRDAGLESPSDLTVDVARTRQYLALLQDPAIMQDPAAEGVMQRLSEASFDGLEVDVNPRYGSWDPETAIVGDQLPEWIAPGQ